MTDAILAPKPRLTRCETKPKPFSYVKRHRVSTTRNTEWRSRTQLGSTLWSFHKETLWAFTEAEGQKNPSAHSPLQDGVVILSIDPYLPGGHSCFMPSSHQCPRLQGWVPVLSSAGLLKGTVNRPEGAICGNSLPEGQYVDTLPQGCMASCNDPAGQ